MNMKQMLLREQYRLETIVNKLTTELQNMPEGYLRISVDNLYARYYHCTSDHHGNYINRNNEELPQKLAQKAYDEKVLQIAEKRLQQIKKFTKDYDDDELEKIYLSLHERRKTLVHPVEPTWEQQLAAWNGIEYQGKEFQDGIPVIYTERGERVRSKTEKIIADYFYHNQIPYKYEKPFRLPSYGTVYPDFTLLSKKTRKEILWEHFGMMDDPAYARNAIIKLETYEKNNLFPGEDLLITYETSQSVLNTGTIERMVKKYIL